MKSKHWDNITTTVRTNIKLPNSTMLFTEKQWLDRGYKPLSNDAGEVLWTNQHCQVSAKYLFLDEVQALNNNEKTELEEKKKIQRKEKKEQKERELEEQKAQELEEKLNTRSVSIIRTAVNTILSERTYKPKSEIVLDTETTGSGSTDELLQVSIIDTDGNTLYNSYIQPLFHESWKEAEAINHISKEMVQDSPTIFEEAKKIADILDSTAAIIGYSVNFDIKILERYGISINEQIRVIDLMPIFAEINGGWNEEHNNYKWQSLTTCANYYGYEWKMDAHNSLADCLATLHCYKKMVEKNQT